MRGYLWLLVPLLALAASTDDRGWTSGEVASQSEMIVEGPADPPSIELPKALRKKITKQTVLFYFSPTCPHCTKVTAEINELAAELKGLNAQLIGVASGSSNLKDIKAYKETFNVDFEVLFDEDRSIGSAMGVRSTPSVLLVKPQGKQAQVVDIYYPFVGGFSSLIRGRVQGDMYKMFEPNRYLGNAACGSCHLNEMMSWRLTHHSVAFNSLAKNDEKQNDECNACHVTGKGEKGGWNGDNHSPLVDVGCESCHGPGGPHTGKAKVKAKEQCAKCHDKKHSLAFSLEKGLPAIDHFLSGHLTEEEQQERWRSLYNNSAERPLMKFTTGEYAGSQACETCHMGEYEAWERGPHHHAMDVLRTNNKHEDPSCVRCHTMSKKVGLPPTTLEQFRLDEGVGCESCHGPGAAHVRSGTKDTIEGLGDDCPVCVLESLCTSCHVEKWDPNWDLTTRLTGVKFQHKLP